MITKFKKYLEPLLSIIAQPFLFINPNILTFFSVLFALGFVVSMSLHLFLLAGLSCLGIIFDALDGYVARKTNKVTKFGAFLDSTTDRISDFFYICAFGFAGFISWPFVSLGFLTTFLISYTKARSESLVNKTMTDGWMQRTERLILLFVCFLLFIFQLNMFGLVLFILFIFLNSLTFFQRIFAVRKLLDEK